MKPNLLKPIILPFCLLAGLTGGPVHSFQDFGKEYVSWQLGDNPYPDIASIAVPDGHQRVPLDSNSFGCWLRKLPLKKGKTVHLFDGNVKRNQVRQFALLDISAEKRDFQQCADAVMKLRAEFLYAHRRFGEIRFQDNHRT